MVIDGICGLAVVYGPGVWTRRIFCSVYFLLLAGGWSSAGAAKNRGGTMQYSTIATIYSLQQTSKKLKDVLQDYETTVILSSSWIFF